MSDQKALPFTDEQKAELDRRLDAYEADISVEESKLASGETGLLLKLSSPQFEVNVWLSFSEAKSLSNILLHNPSSKALCIGHAAGAKAFWSSDADGNYYLLIGEDDETWDVGITMMQKTIYDILDELNAHIAA